MQDILQPLLHKAQVQNLRLHLGRSGLWIGDSAQLRMMNDGHVGIFAQTRRSWGGLFLQRRLVQVGQLGTEDSDLLAVPLRDGHRLRVRIVGVTPEHLATETGPEMFISVWANSHKMMMPAQLA